MTNIQKTELILEAGRYERSHDRGYAQISAQFERRTERADVILAVRFINEFTRLNHRLKNVYELTVRFI